MVVLDEADQLADPDVLYDFHRYPGLSVILIANQEEELFATMDDRVVSRFQVGRRITFDRYSIAELTAILRKRVDHGLRRGAVSRTVLEEIANRAAGDARVGINILRAAAEHAQSEGHSQLTEAIVEDAATTALRELHKANLDRMNEHQRVLYDILISEGPLAPANSTKPTPFRWIHRASSGRYGSISTKWNRTTPSSGKETPTIGPYGQLFPNLGSVGTLGR